MNTHPSLWRGLASAALATGVLAGCGQASSGPTGQPAPETGNTTAGSTTTAGTTAAASPSASAGAAPAVPGLPPSEPTAGGSHRGRGADGASGPDHSAPALPADWPAAIPLPPGQLQGSTGASPRWSVMLTVQGGADEAVDSAMRFYAANGFTPNGNAQLRSNTQPRSTTKPDTGSYTIVMVAMNRDHSATDTNLTIALASE